MAKKIWLIIAAALTVGGLLLFTIVMTVGGWDFAKLGTVELETNTHEITEDFNGISIDTETSDVVFLPSEDGKCRVVCYENVKAKHKVEVVDGVLKIEVNNTRKWTDYIFNVSFSSPHLTVYLPRAEFDSIRVNTATGRIELSNLSLNSLDLSVTTGDISVSGVTCTGKVKIETTTGDIKLTSLNCRELKIDGTTGNSTLKSVIASERILVELTTGDIKLTGCDGDSLSLKTTTGSVTGTLLSEKVFVATATTGSVRVPSTKSGGLCEIRTTTGNIKISID
ncbi:MAG: DUF4097 family beta strand repeat protein [Clostridia bacterium]|nr:DUF4097 family beta strand repeat protein [Clostridia bacterium]